MLKSLVDIFKSGKIVINESGEQIALHSHTPREQGEFLQRLYEKVKPKKSLEVGLAYGISTLFILEKAREMGASDKSHIVIEPFSWGTAAIYNIRQEQLENYVEIRNELSDVVIPTMYLNNERIQFAYVDTTKLFDVVMQDFYFIDKILDVGGVVIIDDSSTGGISLVVRFISTLPHYEIVDRFDEDAVGTTYSIGRNIFEKILSFIPYKKKFLGSYSFKTSRQLGLNYRCIAFKKVGVDERQWNWDKPF